VRKPLVVDLFCGLGGWSSAFLAEGYDCIGLDVERHDYGTGGYPGQLVLQDVLTLDGKQFRGANVIVASPPCQTYSYMAMPWTRAKKLAAWYREDVTRQLELNLLFNACFRIAAQASDMCPICYGRGFYFDPVYHFQEEASPLEICPNCKGKETRNRPKVPLIVENVKGAQECVVPAKWKYKSFNLWGDVPALMPIAVKGFKGFKGFKKDWRNCEASRRYSSHSKERKEWSAQIAKIPFPLAQHIARVFKYGERYEPAPGAEETASRR